METTELKLTNKEVNLLIDGLYSRFDYKKLEDNPESLAAKLMDKLYDAKGYTKSDTNSILHK
tara:strand:- start:5263 stop:5448 length:186 start_codon:yes stop_codon:yes gene_type:complete